MAKNHTHTYPYKKPHTRWIDREKTFQNVFAVKSLLRMRRAQRSQDDHDEPKQRSHYCEKLHFHQM